MKETTVDKIAWVTVILIGILTIAGVILLGWAFIEIINWITSPK